MKAKTINAVLTKKLEDWCATLPPALAKEVERDAIVTGGCIASMLLRETVNDFDVYFRTMATAVGVVNHYVGVFGDNQAKAGKRNPPITVGVSDGRVQVTVLSDGVAEDDVADGPPPAEAAAYSTEVFDDMPAAEPEPVPCPAADKHYRPVFISSNAVTLSQKIQIIFRFYGEPEEIHANYDFIHCTNYWTKATGVVLNQAALESLLTKELRYVGSKYPVCSVIRTRKFVQRGWTINVGQFVKMCFQISQLDLTDLAVLEEQLIGVDVAYFQSVLAKLKETKDTKVDGTYLMMIIDRIF